MTVLALNKSRNIQPLTGQAALALKAAADPFLGSGMVREAAGNVREAAAADGTAGLPFEGFASQQIETRFVATVDGGPSVVGGVAVQVDRGMFYAELGLTGVAADDIFHRRKVYMSDDNAFNMVGTGIEIGVVIGVVTTDVAAVAIKTTAFRDNGHGGFRTLSDAPETLTTADLDKTLLVPNSAARTYTLPPAADCTGRFLHFKKTTAAAFAATLDGNAAETIDGVATNTEMDAQWDAILLISDGSNWLVHGKKIT